MNARKDRQNQILTLIANEPIATQDELITKLREHGYEVTQATISRDIKELKLIKQIGLDGKSIYSAGNRKCTRMARVPSCPAASSRRITR